MHLRHPHLLRIKRNITEKLNIKTKTMNKLLYFSAAWCGPCKALGPTVDKLAGQGLPVQKIDVDNDQALSAQYSVRNIPTLIKVDGNGNALGRLTGNQTAPAIMTWWNGN
jgi:thioredoxin-like negative regulator of GroEL